MLSLFLGHSVYTFLQKKLEREFLENSNLNTFCEFFFLMLLLNRSV